jgi:DNA-binding NarL/FixJ family response regulator
MMTSATAARLNSTDLPATPPEGAASPTTPIRVLIVDDFPLVRSALAGALTANNTIRVVGQASTAEQAIDLIDRLHPDVVTLDLGLPDGDGVQLIEQMERLAPKARVLVVTATEHPAAFLSAIAAGADGYVTKRITATELVRAVLDVHAGGSVIEPTLAPMLLSQVARPGDEPSTPMLDENERTLLELVSRGLTDKEIGDQLFVSTRTVQNYLIRLRARAGVRRRCELVRWASDNHWV